jgi:hypothetical protein
MIGYSNKIEPIHAHKLILAPVPVKANSYYLKIMREFVKMKIWHLHTINCSKTKYIFVFALFYLTLMSFSCQSDRDGRDSFAEDSLRSGIIQLNKITNAVKFYDEKYLKIICYTNKKYIVREQGENWVLAQKILLVKDGDRTIYSRTNEGSFMETLGNIL